VSTRYTHPGNEYFERRTLRRHARVLHLWALGVGAVISGDFFGWNFGLVEGGFGGMLAALAIMTVLFLGLCCGIAEMSPALPHAGGAYSFARTAMGPWGGYITGLAENMEYILTPAAIVVGIGGYLGTIFGTPPGWAPLKSGAPMSLCFPPSARSSAMALPRGFSPSAGCAGLIASFHAIFFAYGRQIYSLSRAGYFPVWLSVTHNVRQTPERALIAGSILGYGTALAIYLAAQKSPVGTVLLNMAVFGAVIAYIGKRFRPPTLSANRRSHTHRPD
jgi:amino acid transporter